MPHDGSPSPATVPSDFERVELREIDLNITNRCNLNCMHCAFASSIGDTNELPCGVIEQVVTDAKSMGCREIHLTGGEPTIHREFERVLGLLLGSGLFTRLISNGIVGMDKLRRYRGMGLGHVLFSVDGLAATHDRIRNRGGAFAATLARAERALDLGYHVRVNAVAMRQNLHEMVALFERCAEMGVQLFSVFLYSPTGRNSSNQLDLIVDPFAWCELKRALAERCQGSTTEVFVEKGFWFPDEPEMEWTAMAGRGGGCYYLASVLDYLIITADGNVFPCALLNDKGIPYGNIYQRRLPDIVARPDRSSYLTYRAFRQPPGTCMDCRACATCHGGCRAFVYAFSSAWDDADPRCQKTPDESTPPFRPLCPLFKENLTRRRVSGFSERLS